MQQALHVDAELHRQWLVEAKLLAYPGNHVGLCVIADDGDDRIDRHHAADQEGDQDEPEQRDRHRTRGAGDGTQPGAHPGFSSGGALGFSDG